MFSLLAGAYEEWTRKTVYNVLLLGLDNAGKTTLLEQIKKRHQGKASAEQDPISTVPTIGMNMAVIRMQGCAVRFWDLGGREELQDIWKMYYADSHAIVFVIDAADWERMEQVKNSFANVANDRTLEGIPVLILANKHDLQENIDFVAKIKELFNPIMDNIGARESRVLRASALYGAGVDEATNWVVDRIQKLPKSGLRN